MTNLTNGSGTYKLEDLVTITTGKIDSNESEESGIYPFFTCAPDPLKINWFAFEGDAILLAGNNANGIYHMHRYNGKFNAYQRTYVLTTTRTDLSLDYLYYFLLLKLNYLKDVSQGTATKFLTKRILNSISVDLPTKEVQDKVASILRSIELKSSLNYQMNKTLESIAQSLFKHWFIDFEFPDENGQPYKSSGGEMVDSELGEIPKGWRVGTLGDAIKFTKGKKPHEISSELRDDFAPLILINALDGYQPLFGNTIGMNFLEKYDPVMVMDGASSGRVEIGFEGILGSTVASTTAKDTSLSNFYIYYYLKTVQTEITENTTGTSIPHADKKRIEGKRIAIPDKGTLLKFTEFSKNVVESIFNRRDQINSLRNIRDLLLPKLMSGKIRVPLEDANV